VQTQVEIKQLKKIVGFSINEMETFKNILIGTS
jgi:hypothetical protein